MLGHRLADKTYKAMKNPPSEYDWMRFIARVDGNLANKCWIWMGYRNKEGYGYFTWKSKNRGAHRIIAEWFYGVPIQEGQMRFVTDHVGCDNPPCVNPYHLVFCHDKQNTLRGKSFAANYARSTHCKRGHERTPENQSKAHKNYYGEHVRACLTCKQERAAKWAAKNYKENNDKMRKEARERQAKKLEDPAKRAANSAYQRERYAKMTPEEKHRRRYGVKAG